MTVRLLLVSIRIELAMFLREPANVFFTLALPVLLVSINAGNTPWPALREAGLTTADGITPGLIVMVILTAGLMVLPETVAGYRERGVLRRLRVSPIRSWQVLAAQAGLQALVTVIGLVLLTGLAVVAFGARLPVLAPFVLALSTALAAVLGVGFLIAGRAPTTRSAQAIGAALYFPALFVSGAVIPEEGLPAAVRAINDWLPFSYLVDGLRAAWWHGEVDGTALGVGIATAAVCAAAATRLFRWS
ncbi:ABC transporter permease [Asanoa siamensis]|uniref:Transport permease protein n=1 Tax=Asanoa siamensis TaxID=926357 RepID=A0ABQ4CKE9_9ACTN|nr:ABC transporter permease [Asanoa siamensis]GIF71757.1 transport permease protein [Asanoa siamensis]